jgi:hypothetical protein
LEVSRPALTRPGFDNFVILLCGWVLTMGQHAVTRVSGRRHHEAVHRFFSRGAWDPDSLGFWLWLKLERLPDGAIAVVLDDTLASKKGPHIFGIGSHLDPVRSTKLFRVFRFGRCWVMLAVLVRVPFSRRPWALPILDDRIRQTARDGVIAVGRRSPAPKVAVRASARSCPSPKRSPATSGCRGRAATRSSTGTSEESSTRK